MKIIEQWFLRRAIDRAVHESNVDASGLVDLYSQIRDRAAVEFYEDNRFTLADFLREHFETAVK